MSQALAVSPVVDRVIGWKQDLQSITVEREDLIHLYAVALVAREHMALYGEPGIAKTMVTEEGAKRIDGATYFIEGIGRGTQLEDLYGPISMAGLEHDIWTRVGGCYSQHCHIVQWTEAFKGSKLVLNSGLRLMNERAFKEAGQLVRAPLSTFIVDSNEEAEDAELDAFVDRLPLKMLVNRVMDRGNMVKLLELDIPENPTPVITWGDFEVAQKEAANLTVSRDVVELLVEIERTLLKEGVRISPRRVRKCLPIIRAEAYLDGAAQVEKEHLAILAHATWNKLVDQPTAQQVVLTLAAPVQQKALDLLDSIEKLGAEVDTLLAQEPEQVTDLASQLQGKLKRAHKKIQEVEAEVGTSRRQRDLVERCRNRQSEFMVKLLTNVFGLTPEAVANMVAGKGTKA